MSDERIPRKKQRGRQEACWKDACKIDMYRVYCLMGELAKRHETKRSRLVRLLYMCRRGGL